MLFYVAPPPAARAEAAAKKTCCDTAAYPYAQPRAEQTRSVRLRNLPLQIPVQPAVASYWSQRATCDYRPTPPLESLPVAAGAPALQCVYPV